MKQENFIRMHMGNTNSGPNKTNTVKASNYPVSPKAEYDTIGEAVSEYKDNACTIRANVGRMVNMNPSKYDFRGPDDGNKYAVLGSPVDMGDGYTAYIGELWPKRKNALAVIIIKRFRLKNNKGKYTVGIMSPENVDDTFQAVFTEGFLQKRMEALKTDTRFFFFLSCYYGLISQHDKDVRWLFDEGMAIGKEMHGFYCFSDYTDTIKFPMRDLTDDEIKKLEALMWNY